MERRDSDQPTERIPRRIMRAIRNRAPIAKPAVMMVSPWPSAAVMASVASLMSSAASIVILSFYSGNPTNGTPDNGTRRQDHERDNVEDHGITIGFPIHFFFESRVFLRGLMAVAHRGPRVSKVPIIIHLVVLNVRIIAIIAKRRCRKCRSKRIMTTRAKIHPGPKLVQFHPTMRTFGKIAMGFDHGRCQLWFL